jgi:hypothetical protein
VIRSAASKVMWVGRTAATIFGLALVLALIFGVATMAFAAAAGDPFRLGLANRINALTTLVGSSSGAMLAIDNDSTATTARALDLRVEPDRTPMRVNSDKVVPNLNADQLDGLHADDLSLRGYARVSTASPHFAPETSRGVLGIQRTNTPGNVYCFNLSFTPDASIASGHLNNNATVGTAVGSGVPAECPDTHDDAAAVTYGANDPDSVHRSDLNFAIGFM